MIAKIFIKLNKLDREKYRIKAVTAGFLIILILLLDLHRFGAWYYGYRTYIKTHWFILLLILFYPVFKYTFAGLIQYLAANKMFKTLYFIMYFIAALPFSICNPYVLQIFAWPGDRQWYELNIFNTGPEFYYGLAWIIPTTLVYIVVTWTVNRFKLFG